MSKNTNFNEQPMVNEPIMFFDSNKKGKCKIYNKALTIHTDFIFLRALQI
jgi:hypothetical protein